MDEELAKILSDSEMDETAKADAIKKVVGSSFVPTAKLTEEKTKLSSQLAKKDEEISKLSKSLAEKMTDDEKQQSIIKQAEETQKQAQRLINRTTAKDRLLEADISKSEIEGILDKIVSDDMDKTNQLIDVLCGTVKNYKQGIEEKVRNELLKNTKPPAGDGSQNFSTDIDNYKSLLKKAMETNDIEAQVYYTRLIATEESKNQ